MAGIICSSTEPPDLRAMMPQGTVFSTVPEKYGVDFYWLANGKKCGIQRKESKDFLASVEDGRLSYEMGQMGALDLALVVVEGRWEFTLEDKLILNRGDRGQRYSRRQLYGLLWSVQYYNVWVGHTDNMAETVKYVMNFHAWTEKGDHEGLKRRPNPKPMFGSDMTEREWGVWLMQGLPGVGPKLAGRIWDQYGCILGSRVGIADLVMVEGIGRDKAQAILNAVGRLDVSA